MAYYIASNNQLRSVIIGFIISVIFRTRNCDKNKIYRQKVCMETSQRQNAIELFCSYKN